MNVQDKAQELIELGRQEDGLDEQRLERNRARILARVAAAGVVGAGAGMVGTAAQAATSAGAAGKLTSGAMLATQLATSLSLVKLGVTAVVVGVLATGSYVVLRSEPADRSVSAPRAAGGAQDRKQSPPPPAAVDAEERESNPTRSDADMEPAPPRAAAAGESLNKPRPAAHQPGKPSEASEASEHAELLRDARKALAGGDAAGALRLLDAHGEVARGPLGPEWAAARILVLCRLGRVAEAKLLGPRFLKSHQHSPLAAQVAGSCAAAD